MISPSLLRRHDGGGDDRPLPGEEEIGIESEGAASEGPVDRQEAEQHVADGRRRQHEGERDDRLGDPLPRELAPREEPAQEDAGDEHHGGRARRHLEADEERGDPDGQCLTA